MRPSWLPPASCVCAVLAAALSLAESPPPLALPTPAPAWCWKPVAGDLGPQDTRYLTIAPTLAALGTGHLWLAWEADGALAVRRRAGDGWEVVPAPPRGKGRLHGPLLRLDGAGTPVLAWRASEADAAEHLHVARWDGRRWAPLGEPLGALPGTDTPVEAAAMVLDAQGHPVVVWQELGARHTRSLHAARWSGSAWRRLGRAVASGSERDALEPRVALDEGGRVWVAWVGSARGRSFVRLSRWSGKAWEDVGGTARGHLRRRGGASGPQLQLVPGGGAVLAWGEWDGKAHWGVELARWTGRAWRPLAAPLTVATRDVPRPGAPALMLPPDGQPLLAYSDFDTTGLRHLYLQRLTPEGGRWLFEGLHLDPGQSDTGDSELVATPDGGAWVLWDEGGGDGRRLRLIHARPCAQGEVPAPLPERPTQEAFWPPTVEAAVDRLLAELDAASRARVRDTPRKELLRLHLGWGMGIRNRFGLWRGNTRLWESCGRVHPDDCSTRIIEAVWERLQREGPAPDAGR